MRPGDWCNLFSLCYPKVLKMTPLRADILNDLGTTYSSLGEYEQALEIRQKLFGEHHPDTATSLHNVGSTYFEMGNPGEALLYSQRASVFFKRGCNTVVFFVKYNILNWNNRLPGVLSFTGRR